MYVVDRNLACFNKNEYQTFSELTISHTIIETLEHYFLVRFDNIEVEYDYILECEAEYHIGYLMMEDVMCGINDGKYKYIKYNDYTLIECNVFSNNGKTIIYYDFIIWQ